MTSSTSKGTAYVSLGLMVGVVLGWAARGVVERDEDALPVHEESQAATESEPANEAPAPSDPIEPQAPPSGRPDSIASTPEGDTSETGFEDQQPVQAAFQTPPGDAERRAIPVSDAHASIIHSQSTQDEETGERRRIRDILESEERDESWSYFMEQTLRMFIANHADAGKFSVFHIECRTTMCEIQVIGFDESTSPDWSRVLYDMTLQPWYEFGQVGTHAGRYQGQLALLTRLTRMRESPAAGQGD